MFNINLNPFDWFRKREGEIEYTVDGKVVKLKGPWNEIKKLAFKTHFEEKKAATRAKVRKFLRLE
jgi:hypothetical protein